MANTQDCQYEHKVLLCMMGSTECHNHTVLYIGGKQRKSTSLGEHCDGEYFNPSSSFSFPFTSRQVKVMLMLLMPPRSITNIPPMLYTFILSYIKHDPRSKKIVVVDEDTSSAWQPPYRLWPWSRGSAGPSCQI